MNHIQKSTPKAELSQLVSPYQLEVAKTLSEAMADNQALHAKITKHINHVIGADLDALRKNYPLRREWCSTISEI